MYINFDLLEEREIPVEVLVLLQAIRQNGSDDLSQNIERLDFFKWADFLESNGYVKYNKPKRKDQVETQLVRLTKKGIDFLDDISTPGVEEIDITMANYFMDVYIRKGEQEAEKKGGMNERSIGNRKKVVQYVAQFRKILGLTYKQMYYLCLLFISDCEYTRILENVFFDRNKNRYGTFKNNLEDSKLYQFYTEQRERVEAFWKQKITEY